MQKKFITIEELCKVIHLSRSTIYKRTCTNRIPHIKIGKKLLFDADEIEIWLSQYRQECINSTVDSNQIGIGNIKIR
jgi:excisionase family DNA binding protein